MKRKDLVSFLWMCSYTCFVFGGIFTYMKFTTSSQEHAIAMFPETKDIVHAEACRDEISIMVVLQDNVCESIPFSQPLCIKGL